jgi:hypothetical protein
MPSRPRIPLYIHELSSGDVIAAVDIEPRASFIEIKLEIQIPTP